MEVLGLLQEFQPSFKVSKERIKNNDVLKLICDSGQHQDKFIYRRISSSKKQELFPLTRKPHSGQADVNF